MAFFSLCNASPPPNASDNVLSDFRDNRHPPQISIMRLHLIIATTQNNIVVFS